MSWARQGRPTSLCFGVCLPLPSPCILPALGGAGGRRVASCLPYTGSWLWTAVTQTSPQLGGGKQSLFAVLGQVQLGGLISAPQSPPSSRLGQAPTLQPQKGSKEDGVLQPPEASPRPAHPIPVHPFGQSKSPRPTQRERPGGRWPLCKCFISCTGNRSELQGPEQERMSLC